MQVGSLASFDCVVDYQTNEYLLLTDGMLGQKAVCSSLGMVNRYLQDVEGYSVEKTEETKYIMGYKCRKFILHTGQADLVYWTTKSIKAKLNGHSSLGYDMEGFPLAFEIYSDGFKLDIYVQKIDIALEDAELLFDMGIPSTFRLVEDHVFFGRRATVEAANR